MDQYHDSHCKERVLLLTVLQSQKVC